jgi:hypothetical protein
MTLEHWLSIATRRLSIGAALQVESEIASHYASALESALANGLSDSDAAHHAIQSLGDPHAANREYRKVLLTKLEAGYLTNFESSQHHVNSTLNRRIRQVLGGLLLVNAAWLLGTSRGLQSFPIFLATALILDVLPSMLPASLSLGRVRLLRWLFLASVVAALWWVQRTELWQIVFLAVAFGWIDWIKASLRRKLPREQWPSSIRV